MMKNNIKNIATVCIASITLLACNDWTDVENIKVNQPDVKEINSEQYAQYLQKLHTKIQNINSYMLLLIIV